MAKCVGTVAYKRRGAYCGVWCFSQAEFEAAQQQAIDFAIEDLRKLKDVEPLIFQLERCNPLLLKQPEAQEVLKKALQGKGFKGRSRPPTVDDLERNERICLAIYLLQQQGVPVKSTSKDIGSFDACDLVAERAHLSSDRIFAIWNSSVEPEGRNLAPWEYLDIEGPTETEILDYCFDREKFRPEQKSSLIRAAVQYAYSQHIKQKQ